MRLARIFFVSALVTLTSATAFAQADEARARQEFDSASTEFGRGNFALALQAFQRAYDMLEGHPRRPLILFNIGRCYEELGRFQDARDAYTRYLHEAGPEAVQREETEARLRELETRVSMGQDGAGTHTDTGTTGTSESGEHDTSGGGASAAASSSAPSDASTSGGGGISPVGPILLGVGGAMVLAGAITGGLTLSSRGDLTAMCTGMACPESSRGLANDVSTLALTTDILLFGGLAVAATGILLTLLLTDGGSSDTAASLTCTDQGCMAFLAGEMN